ncbi:hypothetical protein M1M88_01275 [Peptococcaceae bacterium]|nr:hypothetical protein [Peptococcaceae bacterium]
MEILNKEARGFPEEFRKQILEDKDLYLANGTLYVPESDANIQVFKRIKARFNSTVNNCKQNRVFSKNPPAQAETSKT